MIQWQKKNLLSFLKISLSCLILFSLFKTSQINLSLFINILHHPFDFIRLILLSSAMVIIAAWRWHFLNAAQQIFLSFKKTILTTYLGCAFNNLLPGAVGGDAIRCFYTFKLFPDRKNIILLTILFDRIIGLMGIVCTLCLVALTHTAFFYHQPKVLSLLIVTICLCLGFFLVFMTIMTFSKLFGFDLWLQNKFPYNNFVVLFTKYLNSFRQYNIPLKVWIRCLGISVAMQLLFIYIILNIAKTMGFPEIPFFHYALAASITLLVNLFPITPGGVGIGEMAFANILTLLNPHILLPFATIYLCYRVLTLVFYLPALLFYVPSQRVVST